MKYLARMTAKWGNGHITDIYIGPFGTASEAEAVEKMEKRVEYVAPSNPEEYGSLWVYIGDTKVASISASDGYDLRFPCHSPSMLELCETVDKLLGEHFDVVEVLDSKPKIFTNPFGQIVIGSISAKDSAWWIWMPTCDAVQCCKPSVNASSNDDHLYIGPFDDEKSAINAVANMPIEWIHEVTMPGILRFHEKDLLGEDRYRMTPVKLGTLRIMDNFYAGRYLTEERANEIAAMMRAGSFVVKLPANP